MTSPLILLRLAKLSAAAYLMSETEVQAATEILGYTYVARIASDECVAVIVTEDDEAVVAFQGTRFTQNTDPNEIWDDLDDNAVDLGPEGKVHKGFYAPMLEIWPDVVSAIPPGISKLTLTGHSLGGVRANLALYLAKARGFDVVAVSYGAPKGGNSTFWERIGAKPIRVVNRYDFAPLWPPLDYRWTQPEPMVWLNKAGQMEMVVGWHGMVPSVGDHSIDKYIASLEAMTGANLDTAGPAV